MNDDAEVGFDGDINTYTPGQDTNPLLQDSDGDGLLDGSDPIPLIVNIADGDLAPLGSPDGIINAADLLIGTRITLGSLSATSQQLAHGDLYPAGARDGIINTQDLILLQKLVLP
ncbi:MAG: hypothetical protein V3W04_03270 [Gammaproteobacteria bacterium]